MAAILITENNNLFSITLDVWDWTGLTVNGVVIPQVNGMWTYTQTTPGPVDFQATANYVVTVNPGNTFYMSGTTQTHLCDITYSDSGASFVLSGVLLNVSPRSNAQPGPFTFSQGKMTGVYEKQST